MKMNNFFAAVCVALIPTFGALAADLEVLWWAVPENIWINNVDGTVRYSSLTELKNDVGVETVYARIVDSNGNALLQSEPNDLSLPTTDFELDSWFVPNGPPNAAGWVAAVPEDAAGLSFYIELGNWENETTWTSYAQSETQPYNYLSGKANIQMWNGSAQANPAHVWMPTSYVVPEPTSSLLILLGAAGLALRRRRNFSRG